MAKIENLHPNLSTDLSVFTLRIGLQKRLLSIDFIRLRHNTSIIAICERLLAFYRNLVRIYSKLGRGVGTEGLSSGFVRGNLSGGEGYFLEPIKHRPTNISWNNETFTFGRYSG